MMLTRAAAKVLRAGLDDWVDWGFVAQFASEESEQALDVVEALLSAGLVTVGEVTATDGYRPWKLGDEAIMDRLRSMQAALAANDYLVWVSITPAGAQAVS